VATQKKTNPFRFKEFEIRQDDCPMKVGTDGVLLGAWAWVEDAQKVLDIGTGTGVIAIMLGQRNQTAQIDAVEIDAASCKEARFNMEATPWSDRFQVVETSIQDFARSSREKYDLIVSNPPFFSGGTFVGKQERASVRHTIKLPHGDLLGAARSLLSENGRFAVILPYLEGLRLIELARTYQLYVIRQQEVRSRLSKPVERILLEFSRKPGPVEEVPQLVVMEGKEEGYSEAYRQLTQEFYLNM
jgi:tRNA1Val (adenine37-N6)-methyltransferase